MSSSHTLGTKPFGWSWATHPLSRLGNTQGQITSQNPCQENLPESKKNDSKAQNKQTKKNTVWLDLLQSYSLHGTLKFLVYLSVSYNFTLFHAFSYICFFLKWPIKGKQQQTRHQVSIQFLKKFPQPAPSYSQDIRLENSWLRLIIIGFQTLCHFSLTYWLALGSRMTLDSIFPRRTI